MQIQQQQPLALYVHCLAHCTNLYLKTVGKQSTIIHNDLVIGLNQLINCFPKRSALFQSIKHELGPGTKSLKPLCPTRWIVRTAATNSVLTNYLVLCDTLEQTRDTGSDEYSINLKLVDFRRGW